MSFNIGEFYFKRDECEANLFWVQKEHGNGEGMHVREETLEKILQAWWKEAF